MLLWAGAILILAGLAIIAIDRRLAHFFYDSVSRRFHHFLDATTHLAKAGHWLAIAALVFLGGEATERVGGPNQSARLAIECAGAFFWSLALGSAILHGSKLLIGRRRPRDELEMGLYGFEPLSFDFQHNSLPSGHALTIMCVAVLATCVWPSAWPLWFGISAWLGLTRALLTAHFLSDVMIGAGIGLLSAREIVLNFYPNLAPNWF